MPKFIKQEQRTSIEKFIKDTKLKNIVLNEQSTFELQKLLDSTLKISSYDRRILIPIWIKNELDNWVERLDKLSKLKRRGYTLEVCQLKYGEIEGKKFYEHKNNISGFSLNKCIERHGEKEGKKRFEKICHRKKGLSSITGFIKLYGEIEGKKRWDLYQTKRKQRYKERKEKGIKFRNGRDVDSFIKRFGVDEGFKKWNEKNFKQSRRFSKEYYIEKFGEIEGLKQWEEYKKTMNKTSIKSLVKKYGVEDGLNRYEEIVNKIRESTGTSLEKFIRRYGPCIGREKYKNWLVNTANSCAKTNFSLISQKFFWELYEILDDEKKSLIKFGELNGEEVFYLFQPKQKYYLVDFKCGNVIIEYNSENFHDYSKEEIKLYDERKISFLESKGYKVLTVWNAQYKKNKVEVLKTCLRFIQENFKS